jgi:poly(3-hydroxybutyrate) depolymerase
VAKIKIYSVLVLAKPAARLLALASLSLSVVQQSAIAAEPNRAKQLINEFWAAENVSVQQASREQLIRVAGDAQTLYGLIKEGISFPNDVPTGQQESARIAEDGTKFPYVYLIPENYDSAISYPVEFMLHGGVSRPEWEPGGDWWRRGYDDLMSESKIIVVPAAWESQFWWQQGQADNLKEILRTLKQTYNIDDNRVTLSGVSDGGTGAYFFAFKQPSEWAAFLPYIGHPAVLRNAQSGGGYRLFFENLTAKPLYIVNGEDDPLYPVSSVSPFIDILAEAGIAHIFRPIENGGHNTRWMADESPMIEKFIEDNPRDPFPDKIQWVADRTDRYNRNHWIRIDETTEVGQTGILQVHRRGNYIAVESEGVAEFTLLLNAEEIDFNNEVIVAIDGNIIFQQRVEQDAEVLLDWLDKTRDRSMLIGAELSLRAE